MTMRLMKGLMLAVPLVMGAADWPPGLCLGPCAPKHLEYSSDEIQIEPSGGTATVTAIATVIDTPATGRLLDAWLEKYEDGFFRTQMAYSATVEEVLVATDPVTCFQTWEISYAFEGVALSVGQNTYRVRIESNGWSPGTMEYSPEVTYVYDPNGTP